MRHHWKEDDFFGNIVDDVSILHTERLHSSKFTSG